MFELINGLPLHPLVVHATVVLLPLMSLVTVLVMATPRWRPALGWIALVNAAVVVVAFVTKESGEELERALGEQSAAIEKHANYGDLLPWFAVGLLIATLLVWLGSRQGGALLAISMVLTVVAAAGAIGWTVLTGDSGAQSVWSDAIAPVSGSAASSP